MSRDTELTSLADEVQSALRDRLEAPVDRIIARSLDVRLIDDHTVVFTCPDSAVSTRVAAWNQLLENIVAGVVGSHARVDIVVADVPPPHLDTMSGNLHRLVHGGAQRIGTHAAMAKYPAAWGWHPIVTDDAVLQVASERYSFESFVVGKSNSEAFESVVRLADRSDRDIRPTLLLYGAAGVGKSHLLFAAAREHALHRDHGLAYLSCETALWQPDHHAVARRIWNVGVVADLLLLDDIDAIDNGKALPDVLVSLLAQRASAGLPTLCTSRRDIGWDREFMAALLARRAVTPARIDLPDFATRYELLRQVAGVWRIAFPEKLLQRLALLVRGCAREIQAVVDQLRNRGARPELGPPDYARSWDLVRSVLAERGDWHRVTASPRQVLEAGALAFALEPESVTSASRDRHVVRCRQVVAYVCRDILDISFSSIASAVGYNSSAAAYAAVQVVRDKLLDELGDDVSRVLTILQPTIAETTSTRDGWQAHL